MKGKTGRLFLVPTPLDLHAVESSAALSALSTQLPLSTIRRAAQISCWIVENAKSARAFLNRVHLETALHTPLQSQIIVELPRNFHKSGDYAAVIDPSNAPQILGLLQSATASDGGPDIGLISEAGMPAIADPGAAVVRAAHALSLQVIPLVGPVSILLAQAASGLNGQNFAFVGYLPTEHGARRERIRFLEQRAIKEQQAQVAIEVPWRNAALLADLLDTLAAQTRLCVACGIASTQERIVSDKVFAWKKRLGAPKELAFFQRENKVPAVFAWGA